MKHLPLAILTLALLSACGQRGASPQTGEKPAGSEQADADNEASIQAAAADEAKQERESAQAGEAGAKRMAHYKRAMLPLIAASYKGECTNKGGATSPGAIEVASGGMVTAPGMRAHDILGADAMLTVTRNGAGVGREGAIGFVAGADREGWTVASITGAENSILFSEKNDGIKCAIGAPADKSGPMYPQLAKFFIAGARTMKCTDGSLIQKSFKIAPAATSVTIGSDTFSLVGAGMGEMVIIDPSQSTLSYEVGVIDGERVNMQIGADGLISTFAVMGGPSRKLYSCFQDQQ